MCGGGLREAYAESRGPRSLPGAKLTRGDTTLEPRRGACRVPTGWTDMPTSPFSPSEAIIRRIGMFYFLVGVTKGPRRLRPL
jgi:hypothetical protein